MWGSVWLSSCVIPAVIIKVHRDKISTESNSEQVIILRVFKDLSCSSLALKFDIVNK